jgi:prepilin-type N-terminal cleavage/methylation domain-containing protein/prepilin-type processing-associated H-X9-DG protein
MPLQNSPAHETFEECAMKHNRSNLRERNIDRNIGFTLVELPAVSKGKRSAFTLVELLVVIGIIALLIAMLLPALNKARSQAKTTMCLSNLRSIGQAIMTYTATNKGSLPYGYYDGVTTAPDATTVFNPFNSLQNASDWSTLLMATVYHHGGGTYVTQPELVKSGANFAIPNPPNFGNVFSCPSATDQHNGSGNNHGYPTLHYSCHPRLMPNLDDRDLPANPLLTPYKITHVKNSAEICMIWDAPQIASTRDGNSFPVAEDVDQDGLFRTDFTQGRQWNNLVVLPGMNLDPAVFTQNKDFNTTGSGVCEIRWRHGRNDTCNFLYADGHADLLRLKQNVNADLRLRAFYVNR